jgi:hypothetical protein
MNVRVPPVTYTCAARNKGQTRCHAAAVGSTVAILAQGTSRALASQQAFCVVRFPELSNGQGKTGLPVGIIRSSWNDAEMIRMTRANQEVYQVVCLATW